MAARKKSTAKKKSVKKKVSSVKNSAKKKVTAKKKATSPKKTVAGKTKAKKQTSSAGTRKLAAAPLAKKVKPGSAVASQSTSDSPSTARKSTSKKIGMKARPLTGRWVGERGVIVRQDACLGTFFVTFDCFQNNPVYQSIEWGPYFESQLEMLKK